MIQGLRAAGLLVSVETYQPAVTRACLEAGANVLNPRSPSPEVVKDAAIVGLRTTIRY